MIPIRGNVRSSTVPIATVTLIAVNVIAFLHELSLPEHLLDELLLDWGVVPARQTWALEHAPTALSAWLVPMFTSMFLHGGWLHLIGNMLFLWVFGDGVESRLGPARFTVFYLLAGAAAAQAQIWTDPLSVVPMIGASGAVAGVLGAYVLLAPFAWITVLIPILFIPLFIQVPALLFVVLWFFEQLYMVSLTALTSMAGSAAQVAWWAHIGGALAGMVLVVLFKRPPEEPMPPPLQRVRFRGSFY